MRRIVKDKKEVYHNNKISKRNPLGYLEVKTGFWLRYYANEYINNHSELWECTHISLSTIDGKWTFLFYRDEIWELGSVSVYEAMEEKNQIDIQNGVPMESVLKPIK